MAIILEGFDNSGKSTLAKALQLATGFDISHPGPRPKSKQEIIGCITSQMAINYGHVIMDRVTAISHPAYGEGFSEYIEHYKWYVDMMLAHPGTVIVYCRPPIQAIKNWIGHTAKEYDSPEKLKWLQDNADRVVAAYDAIFEYTPHLYWDWTTHGQEKLNYIIRRHDVHAGR